VFVFPDKMERKANRIAKRKTVHSERHASAHRHVILFPINAKSTNKYGGGFQRRDFAILLNSFDNKINMCVQCPRDQSLIPAALVDISYDVVCQQDLYPAHLCSCAMMLQTTEIQI
jgi:hypothetical protein